MQILLIMLIVIFLAFSVLLLALAKQSPREKQTEDKEQEEYIRDYAETVRQTGGSMKKLEHWKVIAIYLIIYEVLFVMPHGDETYMSHTAVPVGHYVPLDCDEDVYKQTEIAVKSAIKALGLNNCAVNVDLILRDNKVYVIELTGRVGANCLPELVEINFGISSTQTAIFRRNFEFRKLFIARISVAIAPLVITVPLAIILRTYWALVIGNLCGALVNSIVLSVFSNWKPSVYYSFKLLKKMFSYSFWSLCEALANWTIFWVDTFIVGNYFSEYQLGLYKNSTNMVQSIMGMISASMSPVLLSTLSRLKNNPEKYKKAFLNIHSLIIYLVAPMGIGLFLYRKMATLLLFGSKWGEASNIVGAWGLMMMCSVIFYSFPAELYKSKGIPQMLFLSQCIYLLFMIPICVVTAKFGFWIMVYSRCGAIIIQMIIGIVFMKKFFEIDLQDYFKSFLYPLIATIAMILISEVTKWYLKGIIGDFIGILVCVLVYLAVVYVVARKQLLNIIQTIKKEKV